MVAVIGAAIVVGVLGFGVSVVVPPLLARRSAVRAGVTGVDRAALPKFAAVAAVAFDKHGALTNGNLVVIDIDAIGETVDDKDTRWFAGALEHHSQHRIAQAIAQRVPRGNVQFVKEIPGQGIAGLVDRHQVRVGSPDWIGANASTDIGEIVAVEVDRKLMGTITLADDVSDEALSAIRDLTAVHVAPVLVTADNVAAAQELASRAGIGHFVADVTPQSRPEAEQQVAEKHGTVALIADSGRSLRLGEHQCVVAEAANPLRGLLATVTAARQVPDQRRAFQIATALLAVAAAAAVHFLT